MIDCCKAPVRSWKPTPFANDRLIMFGLRYRLASITDAFIRSPPMPPIIDLLIFSADFNFCAGGTALNGKAPVGRIGVLKICSVHCASSCGRFNCSNCNRVHICVTGKSNLVIQLPLFERQ